MSETLIKMLEHIGLPNPYISSTGWIWCDYDDAYSVACCEDNSWIRIKSPLVALPRDESEQSTLLRFLLSKNVGMAQGVNLI